MPQYQRKAGDSKSNSKIASPTARAKLPISGKPIYIKLATGISLGYRRNSGDGVWVVRVSDGQGGNRVEKIALADRGEEFPADGETVLDFAQAQSKALLAKRGAAAPPQRAPLTVASALNEYELDREKAGGDTRIMSRLRVILEPLLNTRVDALTIGIMSSWQRTLEGRAATINRQCASISAALNFAAKGHDILDRRPWSGQKGGGLERIERRGEAKRDRNVILSESAVREIVAEAYRKSYEFGLLVDLSAVTGVRYGQLTACQVQHLQGTRLMVEQSKKGGAGKDRPAQAIEIGAGLADRLRVAAVGRPVTAPLLVKPNGERWRQSEHFERFRAVVKAVGQNPVVVSLYALRHTHITRQLIAGYKPTEVAQWHETSIAEIEKHYARHLSSHVEPPPAPDYGPVLDPAKVTRLRA
jgi:integrase